MFWTENNFIILQFKKQTNGWCSCGYSHLMCPMVSVARLGGKSGPIWQHYLVLVYSGIEEEQTRSSSSCLYGCLIFFILHPFETVSVVIEM